MELRELYLEDKNLFVKDTEVLRERLLSSDWKEEDVKPLIAILADGFIEREEILLGDIVHISIYNILSFKYRDRLELPIKDCKKAVLAILLAMGKKVEGSILDVMNGAPDPDED